LEAPIETHVLAGVGIGQWSRQGRFFVVPINDFPSRTETLYGISTRMDRTIDINNEDSKIYIFTDVNIRPESNNKFETNPITQQETPQSKPG
jgi:hypothetical protein